MSTPSRSMRAGLLVGFCLVVAATQLSWLTFAPVTSQSARALGVDEGLVGDLAVLHPLVFVVLAWPAGRLVDRRMGLALLSGALLTAGGAAIRALAPGSFAVVLGGQAVAALGQPLVLAATTALAARCFPRHRAAVIAAGSAAQFVGVLLGVLGGGPLVAAGGVTLLLQAHAGLAVIAAAVLIVSLPAARTPYASPTVQHPLRGVLGDRLLQRLALLLFVGVGLFNALATWLDPILAGRGDVGAAGPILALMTTAGLLGAALLPAPAAARGSRRSVLLAATITTLLVLLLLTAVADVRLIGVLLAGSGLLLLAGLPIALEWSEDHVGPERAGTATAALLLAGNLGGVVLVLTVQPLIDLPALAFASMAGFALLGLVVAAGLPRRERVGV